MSDNPEPGTAEALGRECEEEEVEAEVMEEIKVSAEEEVVPAQ